MKKKITMVVSLLLVMALSIGGTLAWLTDTETVTNTFTLGNVDITLTETWNTDTDGDKVNDVWSAKFVPGKELAKDPKVSVVAGSEACYVYVKITETIGFDAGKTGNFADYFDYDIAADWTKLTDADGEAIAGVYYMTVDAATATAGKSWYVLEGSQTNANGCVTVPDSVTKTMIDDLSDTNPTLTITAYAIQSEGTGSAYEAWLKF